VEERGEILPWDGEHYDPPKESTAAPLLRFWAAANRLVSFTDKTSLNKKKSNFEIENVDVELLGKDRFGQVRTASLSLQGHLVYVRYNWKLVLFWDRDEEETRAALEDTARTIQSIEIEVIGNGHRLISLSYNHYHNGILSLMGFEIRYLLLLLRSPILKFRRSEIRELTESQLSVFCMTLALVGLSITTSSQIADAAEVSSSWLE
jgi:hypothetical protein